MFPEEMDEILQEVALLGSLDHPNIINYFESYDDKKYFYVVMEFCSGGDIIKRTNNGQHMSEL